MEQEAMRERATAVLSAWNSHDVDRVIACYTEDCVYRDPNTRGAITGREALRRYLTRLFRDWRMRWSLREFFPFPDAGGGAFLWDATLTPATGGHTAEISGMDLVCLRGEQLSRNEVYFDRVALFGEGPK
ncbi:MAG TPA: nuclear transport factor 2 family protein [Candidatus Eisenbacteria bacterium]|nr:nuclear transport factor 2 family protein [Candidatus Eisenbacteria bacterium]